MLARLYTSCIHGTKWFIAMNGIISICILMNHQASVAQPKTGKGHSPDPSSLTDDVTKMEGRKWTGGSGLDTCN